MLTIFRRKHLVQIVHAQGRRRRYEKAFGVFFILLDNSRIVIAVVTLLSTFWTIFESGFEGLEVWNHPLGHSKHTIHDWNVCFVLKPHSFATGLTTDILQGKKLRIWIDLLQRVRG
jgi:hypothetical protein